MPEVTQRELDQADPIGGTAVLPRGVDTNGDPAAISNDQAPVTRFGLEATAGDGSELPAGAFAIVSDGRNRNSFNWSTS